MRRRPIYLALVFGALAALPVMPTAHAQGGIHLSAEVGIGGRYRPNGWVPITVGILNGGTDTVSGQVQISSADAAGPTFAARANIPPGTTPQYVRVCVRGLDPGSRDVAATLVAGVARGDGAIAAQITSEAGTQHNAFTGLPVSPQDLLLVGLSADPTTISRLTGQQWGLTHTSGGIIGEGQAAQPSLGRVYGNSNNPATVQAAAAVPADLPDRPGGYDGVDAVLLRADAPLDALTEAQTDALRAWVASGGHLIVSGGPNASPYLDPFYQGLLPANIVSSGAGGVALILTPKPLPGVRVGAFSGGRPALVTGPYGAGEVTVLAADSNTLPHALWRSVLDDGSSSLLGVAATGGDHRYSYNGEAGELSDAVMRAPSLDAPGAGSVGLFLIGYVLILVPLNYLILKKLDRREWSWATIPALVFIFAAATYAIGDAAKGNDVFVNRAAILETNAGQHKAGVVAAIGLFSPRRGSYDLTLQDSEALVADPVTPSLRFGYGQPQPAMDTPGQARFLVGSEDAAVQNSDVNMWAMRAFDERTATDIGGAVSAHLSQDPRTGTLTGTITNGTQYGLTGCRLFLNGSWQPLTDLPTSASVTITGIFPLLVSGTQPVVWGQTTPSAPGSDGDTRQRMQVALDAFVVGLGNTSQTYYYGNGADTPATFHPRPNEPILMGFCDAPNLAGPAVRVDGHSVTQNAMACVVVHLPLH